MKQINRFYKLLVLVLLIILFLSGSSDSVKGKNNFSRQYQDELNGTDVSSCVSEGNKIGFDPVTKMINFVGADKTEPISKMNRGQIYESSDQAARAYLYQCGALFGIKDPDSELKTAKERDIGDGRSMVRYQQYYQDVPIFAGELNIQLTEGQEILLINSEILSDIDLKVLPSLSADIARQTAIEVTAEKFEIDVTDLNTSQPELWIFNPMIIGAGENKSHLVWRLEVYSEEELLIDELILIDAHKGEVLFHISQTNSALDRITLDWNGVEVGPPVPVCDEENGCSVADTQAVNAHNYAGDTYNFYYENHGRDSIDNSGMTLISNVNYPMDLDNDGNVDCNAFWSGEEMFYSSACNIVVDDVVAHEMTHGVTSYESGLIYSYESGAINESISDIWGEYVDLTNGRGNDLESMRWMIGEDYAILRNMKDPTEKRDPDRMGSVYWDDDPKFEDNGGVHTNCGVGNKAAYLITDGGSFNGYTITGLGITKAANIFYEAQTNIMLNSTNYKTLHDILFQACNNLIGIDGITPTDCAQVRKATLATEMGMEILKPAVGEKIYAGSASNPQKIVIEFTKIRQNLKKEDIKVLIGGIEGIEANIITLYEKDTSYVVEVLPGSMPVNGTYNLNVFVPSINFLETNYNSVLFADQTNVDVDLVIDRSGSMSGTPLASAKAAASQFVDYMQYGDLVGVVSFDSYVTTNYPLTEIYDPSDIVPIFSDNMDAGSPNWLPQSPWGPTMVTYSSPLHSWTDSPYGSYASDANVSLRLKDPIYIPLSAYSASLRFMQRYDIEYDYDNGYVEVSIDGGLTWHQVGNSVTGTNTFWHQVEYDLADYIGLSVLIRFRLESDSTIQKDGWYIDNVIIGTSGNVNTKVEVKAAIDGINSGGSTSIGGGLRRAQEQLTSLGVENHPWSIILLSDGYENATPYVSTVLPSIIESKTIVHTIGLGSGVDQGLLMDIATQTGGTYNLAPTPEQLSEVYNTIAGAVSNRQTLLSTSGTVEEGVSDVKEVVIDSTVTDAIFSISWSNSNNAIDLVLVNPIGDEISPDDASNNSNIDFVSGPTYKYYRIVEPALMSGGWKMRVTDGSFTALSKENLITSETGINYTAQVTALSSLTSQLFFDRDSYSLVEPIKLVMSISDSQPILGATVDVDVSAPSPTASQLIPISEWIELNGDLIPDPQRLEEITAANQTASDTLSLFDDGKHGDGLADDGVYANLYIKTYAPGTYKFTVKASGTSTMGDQFERYGELSTYIEDDPEVELTFTYIPLVIK